MMLQRLLRYNKGLGIGQAAQGPQIDDGFILGPPAFEALVALPRQFDFSLAADRAAMASVLLFDKTTQVMAIDQFTLSSR
jgi:hypothetical protein